MKENLPVRVQRGCQPVCFAPFNVESCVIDGLIILAVRTFTIIGLWTSSLFSNGYKGVGA